MKRELNPHLYSLQDSLNMATASSSNVDKAKMFQEDDVQQQDGGMDELLAVLGYQMRYVHMARSRACSLCLTPHLPINSIPWCGLQLGLRSFLSTIPFWVWPNHPPSPPLILIRKIVIIIIGTVESSKIPLLPITISKLFLVSKKNKEKSM